MDRYCSPIQSPSNKLANFFKARFAYFKLDDSSIDKNKEWLKEYIKNATKLRNSDSNESMTHLYCSDNNKLSSLPPREGNTFHNVGYRIRLGSVIYEWFRDQEYKSFVFKRRNYNAAINEEKSNNENIVSVSANKVKGGNTLNKPLLKIPSHTELMKILSKQLNVEYNEVYNGIAVEQAIVAKANIYSIQNGAFYRRDESTDQNYFQLSFNSTERINFCQFYQTKLPKLITNIKQIDKKWIQFYFDTNVFYCEVIPSLLPLFYLLKRNIDNTSIIPKFQLYRQKKLRMYYHQEK
ncbi:hypothetical protein RFI_38535 [Reticulomyxa filosa]|uniref:Uncharacterized protein n=1 Tax=Reticulomyxa filosa TaxID=46433 RepID=X6LAB3_RETFI|nr:hypothetical protein RFI_38535 [Reticulomyxa filosa]|eukprot:ETN98952.1 hypothetical protein RFI_38535 [Reticulomyxa filosa]